MTRLAAVLAAAAAFARADGGYDRELGLRLLFTASNPSMFHARLALRDDNAAMVAGGAWSGGVSYNALGQALGGGLEGSWGVRSDVRLVAAVEGRGVAATGTFRGEGPNTATDPVVGLRRQTVERVTRFPAVGEEVGATLLLRDLAWCRFAVTARAGVWELADAHEEGNESGPLRSYAWARNYSGVAPGGALALEWEWLPGPVAAFVSLGYRELVFRDVAFAWSDSTGAKASGTAKFPDDSHLKLDFSGPELRLGLEALFSFPPLS